MADEFNILDQEATLTIPEIDVNLSTRASEATLTTRAAEATLATRASEVTLATRASETTAAATAAALGTPTDAAATTDTDTFSLLALFKRSLQHLTSLIIDGRHSAVTLLASAARTAEAAAIPQVNLAALGLHAYLKITANTGGISIKPIVEAQDVLTGDWYPILTSSNMTAIGVRVLKVYPGLAGTASMVAGDVLPLNWRVRVEHNNVNSVTYSLSANLLK